MTRINLLPWRETLKKEQQRQFVSIAAGAVILVALIILWIHINFAGKISDQNGRNTFLEKEIELVDKKIAAIKALESEKEKLLARMNIIQELQSRRPEIVHIFDELVEAIPKGLYLTNIKQTGNSINIEGIAQSNQRISALMKNLDESPWLMNPKLDVIETSDKNNVRTREFTLNVRQEGHSDDTGEEE